MGEKSPGLETAACPALTKGPRPPDKPSSPGDTMTAATIVVKACAPLTRNAYRGHRPGLGASLHRDREAL